ncbi:MAG: methyltransferase [Firmicutes bacterium]|nr:methyltransferase [Bacillota bacterium]
MKRVDEIGFGGLKLVQESDAFCYGTDAVLLAYMLWRDDAVANGIEAIADLGTGNGVVPLILSSKTKANILGIDVQADAINLANETAELNSISERLKFVQGNVRDIEEIVPGGESLDAVTMNPPYTEAGRGLASPNVAKAIARQEIEGTLKDFIGAAAYLLKTGGHLYIVHRPGRLTDIIEGARRLNLEPKEIQFVSGKRGEEPNILLFHAIKGGKNELKILPEISVRNDDGSFTEDMKAAYK